jgi:hypothetical protein
MQDRKTLGRREFTVASALAALSGVAITLSGCGGSSSPTAPGGSGTPTGGGGTGDLTGTIGTNHGHSGAVITAAQLMAGNAVSLDITGAADHPHTVTLTPAEVRTIAAGTRVPKASSTDDGHSHTVTFN